MLKEAIQYREKPQPIGRGFSVCSTRDAGLFSQSRWSIVKLASLSGIQYRIYLTHNER